MRSRVFLVGAWLVGAAGSARAEDGSLTLRVEPTPHSLAPAEVPGSLPRADGGAPSPAKPTSTPAAKPGKPGHQKGPAPKVPADTLPVGAARAAADEAARRVMAEGATREQVAAGPEDPELVSLRAADEVLFPTRLRGVEPGWSWDLPESTREPELVRGVPSRPTPAAPGSDLASAEAEWLRTLTMPDLPVRLDRRVVTYLKFYRDDPRGRTIAAIWAKKSGRYIGALKAELRRAGLPPDLVWLSMIESGHNPTITSPVGAAGLWQFMAPSARMYGLTVDRWVDERRDPARATAAAVQLLGDLYQRFGNWELTMAAYNMGYAGLSRAIAKFNTNDYWTLSRLEGGIPWETTLYVPKIFALAIVMNNRDAFGLGRIVPDPAVSFDTILVAPATELDAIARAAGTTREVLAELNPAFLTDRLPPPLGEPHALPVRVPSGRGEAAKRVHASVDATRRTIVVRQGDDLSTLALDYGGAEAEWARVNDLGKMERLEPGTVLLAPAHAKQEAAAPAPAAVVVGRLLSPAKSERLVFYEVRPGDDLERIAEAFGVASRALGNWNSLDPAARLREGMTLQALVDRNQDLSRVRHRDARGTRVLVAGSPEFHEHFESLRGMHRVEVVVRAGDTLGSIGNRHGMSVGSMERVNRRSRSTKLVPGEVLIVYTDKPGAGPGGDAGAAPLEDIDPPRPELLPSAAAALP